MICAISFLFGPAIPVLFPMGLVGLIILYACERVAIAYYHRIPPNIDDSLNIACINDVLWTPMFYLSLGFWLFSNKQIFENKVIPLKYQNEVQRMDHGIIESMTNANPGSPLLLVLLVYSILQYFG